MNFEKCPCLSLLNSYAERTIDLTETYGIVAKCEEGEKAEICRLLIAHARDLYEKIINSRAGFKMIHSEFPVFYYCQDGLYIGYRFTISNKENSDKAHITVYREPKTKKISGYMF